MSDAPYSSAPPSSPPRLDSEVIIISSDDEHDPEGSSTAFERAHTASLLARARDHLAEVDRALERLERGDYGRCERCREPIPPGRLEVRPAATTCVRCAAGTGR